MISGPLTAQKTDHYTGAFDWRLPGMARPSRAVGAEIRKGR